MESTRPAGRARRMAGAVAIALGAAAGVTVTAPAAHAITPTCADPLQIVSPADSVFRGTAAYLELSGPSGVSDPPEGRVSVDGNPATDVEPVNPQPDPNVEYYDDMSGALPAGGWDTTQVSNGTHELEIGDYNSTCHWTFSVTVDNVPPTVAITTPAAQSFVGGNAVTVSASAAADHANIDHVDFYAGQQLLGTARTAPYSVSWDTTDGTWPNEVYQLYAQAFDTNGLKTKSALVPVEVHNSGTVLSLGLDSSGSSYPNVALTATLTDALDGHPIVGVPIAITGSAHPFSGFRSGGIGTTDAGGRAEIVVRDPFYFSTYRAHFGGSGGEHASDSAPLRLGAPLPLHLSLGRGPTRSRTTLTVSSPRGFPTRAYLQQRVGQRWVNEFSFTLNPTGTTHVHASTRTLGLKRLRVAVLPNGYFPESVSNGVTFRLTR